MSHAALDKLKRDSKRKEEDLSDEIDRMKRASERERDGFDRKLEEANKQVGSLAQLFFLFFSFNNFSSKFSQVAVGG